MAEEAAWDPFADPADSSSTVDTDAAEFDLRVKSVPCRSGGDDAAANGASAVLSPANPWEDEIFVELSRKAAKEAAEREAAAQEAAVRRDEDRRRSEREALEREVAERERRVAARRLRRPWEELTEEEKLTVARKMAIQEAAYLEAMDAARGAPKALIAKREEKVREFYEKEAAGTLDVSAEAARGARLAAGGDEGCGSEETGFREAAARMMAAQMGIKVSFRPLEPKESKPVGLLFPDQSSRSLRMLSAARNMPGVPQMLDLLGRLLGFDPLEPVPIQGIWELFRGPEAIPPWLEDTRVCQPVMYVCALAGVERLRERRPGSVERCQAVAGLSLGELAALTAAGVLDFELGLRLAALRGEAMQEAADAFPQRMVSVAGLDRRTVDRLCGEARRAVSTNGSDSVCQVAQCLFPDGFVCAGEAAAMDELLRRARATEGCKQVTMMKAAGTGGFHTPLMALARTRMLEAVHGIASELKPPRCDVYLGVNARRIRAGTPPGELIPLVCDQLTSCVLWEDVVRAMLRDGVGQFYECGPMQQLKGMMKRIDEAAFSTMMSVDHIIKNVKERPQ